MEGFSFPVLYPIIRQAAGHIVIRRNISETIISSFSFENTKLLQTIAEVSVCSEYLLINYSVVYVPCD